MFMPIAKYGNVDDEHRFFIQWSNIRLFHRELGRMLNIREELDD